MTRNNDSIDTRLQHRMLQPASGGEPVSQAIFQTSTYQLPSPELGAEIAAGYLPERYYTPCGSPNVARVEAMVADLEGAEAAVAVDRA